MSKFSSATAEKKVFISYAKEDYEIAEKLYRDLRSFGVSPWLDQENLLPGQDWEMAIREAIKESSYMLALLSSHSVSKKGYVQKELKQALTILDELPHSQIFIIPVRLDNFELKDGRLQKLHWVNLFSSYDRSLEHILRVILPVETSEEKIFITRERTKIHRKFLINAGFDIKAFSGLENYIATPKISLWKKRFYNGIYVCVWLDNPLDNNAVNSIFQKAEKHTNHALVLTNQQPKLDGWMAIASMRLNDNHPFVLIPITDIVIKEGIALKNERQAFADYIEKYIGKGYNPYDVRDPVFDVLSFFGRGAIIDEILNDLKSGKRIGLFGIHKIGKSSVLKTLQKKLDFPAAYVYLEKNISLDDIYENILKSWENDIRLKFPDVQWETKTSISDSNISFKSRVKNLLESLEHVVPIPHLSVFLDEIETIVPYKEGDEKTFNCYINLMDSLRGLQHETGSISLLVAGVHPTLARVNYFWGNQKNPMHQVIVEKFLPSLDRDDCGAYLVTA